MKLRFCSIYLSEGAFSISLLASFGLPHHESVNSWIIIFFYLLYPLWQINILLNYCDIRAVRVSQATNFCLLATGKTYFFHTSLSAGHPGFHG